MKLPDFLIDHPDGEIRLVGHRIGLFDIAYHARHGDSAEMIQQRFPDLSLEEVEAVLRFGSENRVEVDAYVEEYQAEIDRLRAAPRTGPTRPELLARLAAKKAQAG